MVEDVFTMLSKIEHPPYGIRRADGSWKLFRELCCSQDLLPSLEKLISTQQGIPTLAEKDSNWKKLISSEVGHYINKYHPDLKLIDVSTSRDYILFSHIQAHNINLDYWKGGHAGSVALVLDDAKNRTISEVIERTALSSVEETVWASAIAPNANQAANYAKLETIERWAILQWWFGDPCFKLTENLIPHLSEKQRFEIDAVLFEWKVYDAHIQCRKMLNPFGLEIVLAIVDIFLAEKHFRFYGNGSGINLKSAAEKACRETLQFIPGPQSNIWIELDKSSDKNDQRIRTWPTESRNSLFSNEEKFISAYLFTSQSKETFYEKIDTAFKKLNLKLQISQLEDCHNFFIAFAISLIDWRKEKGIPIV